MTEKILSYTDILFPNPMKELFEFYFRNFRAHTMYFLLGIRETVLLVYLMAHSTCLLIGKKYYIDAYNGM